MNRDGVVVLVSGGPDSLALVQRLRRRGLVIWPLYVRCGFRWEAAETFWLTRWLARLSHPSLKPLKTTDMSLRSIAAGHWSFTGRGVPSRASADAAVYLPARNILLLTHAALYAVSRRVSRLAVGTLAGNPFGDATLNFFHAFAGCLRQALGRPFSIAAPLRRVTKTQVIAEVPASRLALTFSCLRPRGLRHCGRCNKCAERQRACRQAGVADPTVYAT